MRTQEVGTDSALIAVNFCLSGNDSKLNQSSRSGAAQYYTDRALSSAAIVLRFFALPDREKLRATYAHASNSLAKMQSALLESRGERSNPNPALLRMLIAVHDDVTAFIVQQISSMGCPETGRRAKRAATVSLGAAWILEQERTSQSFML